MAEIRFGTFWKLLPHGEKGDFAKKVGMQHSGLINIANGKRQATLATMLRIKEATKGLVTIASWDTDFKEDRKGIITIGG